MRIAPFALERHFALHEFTAPHLLSSSDCDGLPLADVLSLADDETRALWEDLRLGYTDSRGLPLLRAEIAKLYPGVSPDQIMVMVPEEAIFVAMNALLKAGDHVVCAFPGYQSLYAVAESLGCEVTRWRPREDEGWRFAPEDLAALLRPDTKLLVVNFPHNPTGALPSAADHARILELARGCGARVFSDEMYRFLELDPAERLPSVCALDARAVSLFGMSKTFGLAGLRVGWLATRDADLYARLAELRDYTTICGAAPSELLAVMALRARDRLVAAHVARLKKNLAVLDEFFRRRPDFSWTRPRAGTVALARLPAGTGADAFCARAVKDAGVMVLPSTVYGFGDAHIRLGYGRAAMPEALNRLESLPNLISSGA